MADNPESPTSNSDDTSAAGKSGKAGKAKKAPKVEYGSMRFRLPKGLERALRYASFEMEEKPKAVHKTPQAILEDGMRRHLDYLSKYITFPSGMLTHKSTPE
jgi:hypothetical protein